MPIVVTCRCGKKYKLADEAAGRRATCKQCNEIIHVPFPQPIATESAQAPIANEPSIDSKLQDELDRIRKTTQSAAARPGMLSPSRLRYVLAFPFWASVWHGLFLISAMLILVHWIFVLPTLFFAYAVHLYWRRIRFRFVGGCVNPGIVLSTSPPRIAVITNLTKGGSTAWNVIKVMSHPVHRMSTGKPVVGQRIVTIAGYSMSHEDLPHWIDFNPTAAAIVCTDNAKLEQLINSINQEDWQELEDGLKQLRNQLSKEGIYRLYDFDNLPAYIPKEERQVERLASGILNADWITRSSKIKINHNVLNKISSYVPQAELANVLATCDAISGNGQGIALTSSHLYFNFKETGPCTVGYYQLAGAMVSPHGVELCMRDGTRIVLPDGQLLNGPQRSLEHFISKLLKQ